MADISQGDIEEMTRRYSEEKVARLIGEIVKNNEIIIKTQKQLGELLVEEEKKRRQENREMERRRKREQEETDKWIEECRRKNEKKE